MAYKALKANSLPFDLIRSEDIKNGRLKNYAMLFVPGGWASNKIKALGGKGITEIKKFVRSGGNYLGFCGGAGLATLDGIGLLNIKRKPTNERVPSFSGRIHLNIKSHPIFTHLPIYPVRDESLNGVYPFTPIFNAWWPSQFLTPLIPPLSKGGGKGGVKKLAAYGDALLDSFSSDLNVGDIEGIGGWKELEKIYGINLDPKRLLNEPAVVEGRYGKGRVILSLIHLDTPEDENGAVVLKNLWKYLGGNVVSDDVIPAEAGIQSAFLDSCFHGNDSVKTFMINRPLISEIETIIEDLIALGIRNFLWFWRNPMLLQWRRGVRGLEYCTLYVMVKELSALSGQLSDRDKEKLHRIKKQLMPFTEKAKQLLILERHAMQNGQITYERCDDSEIQKLRTELFSSSKRHGGLFKKLIDEIDNLLFSLIN